MALYKQIQCAICLCDFTDPVSLPCEHSFCRLCILGHLQACNGQSSCPECRQQFTKDDLRPSPLLRNVIEAIQASALSLEMPAVLFRFVEEEDDTLLLKDKHFMVIPDSLSLGSSESPLQFFVWKEMLRSIKPISNIQNTAV
ncbi:hypothetical protein SRHO_G00061320 [Serrasalmus rhombeus]